MNLKLLKQIIRMDQDTLYDFLLEELSQTYSRIDTDKELNRYMFCKGDLPIMVVAHLDTVFEGFGYFPSHSSMFEWGVEPPLSEVNETYKEIFHDRVEQVMWSPEGLGADDRVGVFMILSLVRAGLKPSILFTTDEETGSASGKLFVKRYRKKFHKFKINHLVELDRSGVRDCVFYNGDNHDYQSYIRSFGFTTAYGSFTDISILCPGLKMAGVNLSVGYFNEHTVAEMIDLFTMSKNFDIIYYMVKESKKIKKPFEYVPKKLVPVREFKNKVGKCVICDTLSNDCTTIDKYGKVCSICVSEMYI